MDNFLLIHHYGKLKISLEIENVTHSELLVWCAGWFLIAIIKSWVGLHQAVVTLQIKVWLCNHYNLYKQNL